MAILTAYDTMGTGLSMADTSSAFVPNTGLTLDGAPNVSMHDSDTYLISQWYEGYTLNLGIYVSQYSGDIWTIESLYAYNANLQLLMGSYAINIRFNITDDFSSGVLFTNMFSGNDSMTGNKFNDIIKSGLGNDTLVGNAGNDKLYGESGNDVLKGGADKDILYGGTGADKFVFNTTLNATTNLDTIKDFVKGTDKIVLDDDIFTKFANKSSIAAGNLITGTKALQADDYLIYNTSNDTLYYDQDGSGSKFGLVAFAKIELTGSAAPSATDFQVIA